MTFANLSELEAQIEAIKDQKKLVKGDKEKEAALASQLKELNVQKAQFGKSSDSQKSKITVKVPKGTRDFNDKEMAVREHMFDTIKSVFKKHGAVTIDTPVFELKEILSGKYGEDSKLIYDLKDQGGEICSLRYDLTVPFARFLAMNRDIQNIKRYHIAKVYRRDNPSINKGRMREFNQCDFDIAGNYEPMVPDAEVIKVAIEILEKLDIGSFFVKLNNRKILDGMFQVCGVPQEKIRSISSAVDKLDKMPWEEVKKEMTGEKGLDPEVADRIGKYVSLKGGAELCEKLIADATLYSNESAKAGIDEMKTLFVYLDIFGIADKISFDLSLARGLDYYTGVIYEAVFNSTSEETSGVGSIAAGGRYDGLVGMFSGNEVPCVGVSIGIERVYAILMAKKSQSVKTTSTEVYVSAVDGQLAERMKICKELWENSINAEFTYKANPKIKNQLAACEKQQIPFAIIIGSAEVQQGVVKVKELATGNEETVTRAEMISYLKKKLGK
ncbi:hypothetical protein HDV01_002136 [Terramyces sp. JEL0728]|nr:hypothetical protein HDV01_002136 [Terramyces sp. JEL0728]